MHPPTDDDQNIKPNNIHTCFSIASSHPAGTACGGHAMVVPNAAGLMPSCSSDCAALYCAGDSAPPPGTGGKPGGSGAGSGCCDRCCCCCFRRPFLLTMAAWRRFGLLSPLASASVGRCRSLRFALSSPHPRSCPNGCGQPCPCKNWVENRQLTRRIGSIGVPTLIEAAASGPVCLAAAFDRSKELCSVSAPDAILRVPPSAKRARLYGPHKKPRPPSARRSSC